MNTPSYILQRNNQVVVNVRPFYCKMGFKEKHYSAWFNDRITQLNLERSKDFEVIKNGRFVDHTVPVQVALNILGTVYKTRSEPMKNEIAAFLSQDNKLFAPIASQAESSQSDSTKVESQPTTQPEVIKATTVPAVAFNLPIPVYQIDARAAVNAADLFRLWNGPEERRLGGWLNYRIDKLGLVLGKHYTEYDIPPSPSHRRGFTGYILSLDAAISIADGETKGKGRELAEKLIEYRKELAKLRLSTKGPLSDFMGMEPSNLAVVETEPVEQVNSPVEENAPVQGSLFDSTNQPEVDTAEEETTLKQVHGEGDSIITPDPDGIIDSLYINVLKDNDNVAAETSDREAPQQEAQESTSEGKTATQADADRDAGSGPQIHRTPDDDELTDSEDAEAPIMPTASVLLLQAAQLLLQMAQMSVDHERRINETRQTVGQLVAIGQQAALQTLGLSNGSQEPPEQTLRSRIRQVINERCRVTGEDPDQIYAFVYNRLYYLYGINVNARDRRKGETYLALCERIGALDKVFTIVHSAEFTAAMRNAPVHPTSEAA